MSYNDISLSDYKVVYGSGSSSFLPLTEPSFYILLSLAPGKKHRYAILKDIRELSGDRLDMSTSTLYTALGRLLDQHLIERLSDGENGGPGLPRKSYALTDLGRRVLEAETVHLQGMVKEAACASGTIRHETHLRLAPVPVPQILPGRVRGGIADRFQHITR